MTEVFSLIGNHPEEEEYGHTWEGEEAGSVRLTNEESELGSATISYVDSLLREDCVGRKSPQWEDEEGMESTGLPVKASDVVMGSPERVRLAMGMESERFQSATDVLARHYGARNVKGQSRREAADPEMMTIKKNVSYTYVDDEDEIKV